MGQFIGLSKQQLCEQIARYSSDYEYVEGFTDTNGSVILRCRTCGATVKRTMVTVRHYKNVRCTECKKKETAEKNKRHKEFFDFQKRLRRRSRYEQMAMKTCKECGSLFFPDHGSAIYCNPKCANRFASRNHEMKRRATLSGVLVDKDIGLQRVYDRDSGHCWLCGGRCDFDDYKIIDGVFVAGNRYPSIDHVVALANGGEHSWKNVRLAHRICNSIKQDKNFLSPPSIFNFEATVSTDGDFTTCLKPAKMLTGSQK